MVKYFLDAVKALDVNGSVPYYLNVKIKDLVCSLSLKDKFRILDKIMKSDNPSLILRYFSKMKILYHFSFYLQGLKKVPQKKGRTTNAFEHTLNVLDQIPKRERLMRWVGLLHDMGKFDSWMRDKNFNQHSKYGAAHAKFLCDIYKIPKRSKIINIVQHHMEPLDYQKQPNWSDDAIRRFIKRVGKRDVLDVVQFSFYDKMAENNRKAYLQIIEEFQSRVVKLLREERGK